MTQPCQVSHPTLFAPLSRMISRLPFFAVFSLFLVLVFSNCKRAETHISVRQLAKEEQELKIVETTAERFRYSAQATSQQDDSHSHGSEGGPRLVHDIPEGWQEKPGAMMRDINLTFGENGEGECYLSRLPGAGGGLVPNVNRWRKQMGAAELSAEEVAALPKKKLFGQPATFVQVDGDFGGMSGTEGKKDYRLLGMILSSDNGAVFVKMVGPRKLVEANQKKFDEFVASINISMQ